MVLVKMKFKKIKNKNNLSNLNYSFFVDLLSKYFIVFFKCNYSNFITKGAFFKDIKFENKIKRITNVIDYYFLNIKSNLELKHYFKGIKGLYHFIYIRSKSLKFLGRLRKISLNSLNNLRKISFNRFKFLLNFKKNLRNISKKIIKKNIKKIFKKNIKKISLKRAKFLERKLKVRLSSVIFLKCVKILNPNNLEHFKKMTNLRMLSFYKMITNPKNVKFYNYKKRTNPKFFKHFKILKKAKFFKILKTLKKIKFLKILKFLKKISYKYFEYKIKKLSKSLK